MFPSSVLNLPTLDPTDSMANAGAAAGNPMGMVSYLNSLIAEVKALENSLLNGSWSSVPTGTIVPFAGPVAPTNYLVCDGSAVSRSTYPNLWAALSITTTGNIAANSPIITNILSTAGMDVGHPISGPGIPTNATITSVDSTSQIHISINASTATTGATIVVAPWGLGDLSTTFSLPDMRGRVLSSKGTGAGLTNRVLGSYWGEENHTLVTAEMPVHAHTVNDSGHIHGISDPGHTHSVSDGGHAHTVNGALIQYQGLAPAQGGNNAYQCQGGTAIQATAASGTGIGIVSRATGIGISNHTTGISLANTGSGSVHNNIQPTAGINHIIRI